MARQAFVIKLTCKFHLVSAGGVGELEARACRAEGVESAETCPAAAHCL